MNILLIESNPADRLLLKIKLREFSRRQNTIFSECSTLKRALAMAKENVYDLIILNLNLDDCVPYKAASRVKDLSVLAPIIVSGSLEDEDLQKEIERAGVKDFFDKRETSSARMAAKILKVISK